MGDTQTTLPLTQKNQEIHATANQILDIDDPNPKGSIKVGREP